MASNDETRTTAEAAEDSSHRGGAATSTKAGADDGAKGGSPDPDKLVQEIEQTREDLADTLDAIVDRVSPKRVMDRTKEQARSDAHDALQTVKESAASAAQTVKGAAASAADAVKEQVASVKERVSGGSEDQPAALTGASAATSASSRRLTGSGPVGDEAGSDLAAGDDLDRPLPGSPLAGGAPLSGSPLPGGTVSLGALDGGTTPTGTSTSTSTGTTTTTSGSSSGASGGTGLVPTSFPPPVLPPAVASKAPLLAGAGAAVAVVLLLLRRRRR